MVLLVIDTQKLITNNDLYAFDKFVLNERELINTAREHKIEVIYIRHDDGAQCALTKGKDGFDIYEEFQPCANEKIYDKTVNSVFKDTGLLEYLKTNEETELIVTGLQTDFCIDATVKCGFEHGFTMIVPAYANTTVNNEFMSGEKSYAYYNEFMWKNRYAKCMSMKDVLEKMRRPR